MCEHNFGGTFLVRSHTTEHAYCFLPSFRLDEIAFALTRSLNQAGA